MPDPHPTSGQAKPTAKQLAYLRALAERTGQTFAYQRTSRQASIEIRRLRGQKRTPRADRIRERSEVSDDLATKTGDAARIRGSEITGYGADCQWLHQARD